MNKLFKLCGPIFFCCCFISSSSSARVIKTTMKSALFNKNLVINASPLIGGGFLLGLKFDFNNKGEDTFMVTIDPALIFVPNDTNYQNLVTWGSEVLFINARDSASIKLHAFCGKSYARCPKPSLNYKFSKQGDSNMVKTMKYARENNLSEDLTQKAVWTYTNNHPLSSVYSYAQPKESEQFVKFIAGIRKMKVPDEFLEIKHHAEPDKPVFNSSDVRKLFVPVKWKDNDNVRHMFVTVLKENGDIYKHIQGNEFISGDEHTVLVEFNSVNDTKGIYYVELKDSNNKVWDRHKVVIGYEMEDMAR